MPTQTATSFRNNLFQTLDSVIKFGEPLTVTSKSGNVVILSEEDYNSLMETLYLMSSPGVDKQLREAMNTDKSEFVEYDPNEKW